MASSASCANYAIARSARMGAFPQYRLCKSTKGCHRMIKINRTGRGRKAPRHVRLYYWITDSPAWHDLGALERALYAEIAKLYDGSNNGKVFYSVRTAAAEFGVRKSTAWWAIQRLIDNGFLVLMKKGAFSLKHRHATEWRLTEFPCDVTHDLPTKDFMRWNPCPRRPKPSHKKQNTVLLGTTWYPQPNRSVPPVEPIVPKMAATVPQ